MKASSAFLILLASALALAFQLALAHGWPLSASQFPSAYTSILTYHVHNMLPAPFPWPVNGTLFLVYGIYCMASAFFHLGQVVHMVCMVKPSSHHRWSHLPYRFYHGSCSCSSFEGGHHALLWHCLTRLVEFMLLFSHVLPFHPIQCSHHQHLSCCLRSCH